MATLLRFLGWVVHYILRICLAKEDPEQGRFGLYLTMDVAMATKKLFRS